MGRKRKGSGFSPLGLNPITLEREIREEFTKICPHSRKIERVIRIGARNIVASIFPSANFPLPQSRVINTVTFKKAGAPKKDDETYVALQCRIVYDAAMISIGKRSTVKTSYGVTGGPFVELLRKIFRILGIRASPVARARDVIYPGRKAKEIKALDPSGIVPHRVV